MIGNQYVYILFSYPLLNKVNNSAKKSNYRKLLPTKILMKKSQIIIMTNIRSDLLNE